MVQDTSAPQRVELAISALRAAGNHLGSEHESVCERLETMGAGLSSAFTNQPRQLECALGAMCWSIELHGGDRRPTGGPYLDHILDVVEFVREMYTDAELDAEVVAAAFLHDALEDHPVELAARAPRRSKGSQTMLGRAALDATFGPAVAQMVFSVTNPPFEEMILRRHGYRRGTPAYASTSLTLYCEHFVEIFERAPSGAALIKLADFSSNALSLQALKDRPEIHEWLARKYGPCVRFLIERLPAHIEIDGALGRGAKNMLPRLRRAWECDYSPTPR